MGWPVRVTTIWSMRPSMGSKWMFWVGLLHEIVAEKSLSPSEITSKLSGSMGMYS